MHFTSLIVHSDKYADAVSLPVHPKRHLVAWDLVTHYALSGKNGAAALSVAGISGAALSSRAARVNIVNPFEGDKVPDVAELMPLLLEFHDDEYVRYVQKRSINGTLDERHPIKRSRDGTQVNELQQQYAKDLLPEADDEEYGLTKECHPYRGMFRAAVYTVWGTVCAVRALTLLSPAAPPPLAAAVSEHVWCAMHWWGGRHHAKRDCAEGFCFFNDVVIGVQELQKRLKLTSRTAASSQHVLVLDIDAHHGDGTQDAFFHDPLVFTCSLHRFGVGVFPGSGRQEECGGGFGKGACSNIPLKEGCTGAAALAAIVAELHRIWSSFHPDAVVIVCGADALRGDPLGGLNFEVRDIQNIIRRVMEKCWMGVQLSGGPTSVLPTPLLLLGAGGYVDTSFAKVAAAVTKDVAYWTRTSGQLGWGSDAPPLLSSAMSCDTDHLEGDESVHSGPNTLPTLVHVPETCEYFSMYGPSFLMGELPPALHQKVMIDGLYAPDPQHDDDFLDDDDDDADADSEEDSDIDSNGDC
jgi:histone deacetylase 1/2